MAVKKLLTGSTNNHGNNDFKNGKSDYKVWMKALNLMGIIKGLIVLFADRPLKHSRCVARVLFKKSIEIRIILEA